MDNCWSCSTTAFDFSHQMILKRGNLYSGNQQIKPLIPRLRATYGQSRLSVCLACAYQGRGDNKQTPGWY